MSHGRESPDAVEKKARSLAQQTLDAVRGAADVASTSVARNAWLSCPEETPGQHRYEYVYTLNVGVPQSRTEAALAAAKAHFKKLGYTVDPPEEGRAGATLPNSNWTVALGVKDDSTIVIQADTDCVSTSHSPQTT